MSNAVLANHAHVFPDSMNPNGTIGRLIQLMDKCEIESVVCFAPFPHDAEKIGLDPNRWLASELARRPQLLGFGTIDFRKGDVRDQVRRVKDLGLRGLKLHPNAQEFDVTGDRPMEVYGAAEELGLFCTFHTGVHRSPIKNTRVLKFDEVAWKYPKLKFSMEHVGGWAFFQEAVAVIFNHLAPPWDKGHKCNVFAGLSSIFTPDHNRFWYLGRERLLELVAQVGVDQLVFGLDYPFNVEEQTMTAFAAIRNLGLSLGDQQKILGGNLRRELGLA